MTSDCADDRPIVVYIAGAGRSGSTLLERLLAERLNAVQVGELRMILAARRWGVTCECGAELRTCPQWSPIVDAVFGDLDDALTHDAEATLRGLASNRSVRRLLRGRTSWTPTERDVAGRYASLYPQTQRATGANVIIDSSKTPAYGLMIVNSAAVDLRVVHLVRDSRAVAYSWQRPKPWTADGQERMQLRSPLTSARMWMVHDAVSALLARRVVRSTTIRYEDLVADPDAVVASAIAELSLARSEGMPRKGHGILGNPVRFDKTPRAIRVDDEWRRSLSWRDTALTTALTWPLLVRHGYPILPKR